MARKSSHPPPPRRRPARCSGAAGARGDSSLVEEHEDGLRVSCQRRDDALDDEGLPGSARALIAREGQLPHSAGGKHPEKLVPLERRRGAQGSWCGLATLTHRTPQHPKRLRAAQYRWLPTTGQVRCWAAADSLDRRRTGKMDLLHAGALRTDVSPRNAARTRSPASRITDHHVLGIVAWLRTQSATFAPTTPTTLLDNAKAARLFDAAIQASTSTTLGRGDRDTVAPLGRPR